MRVKCLYSYTRHIFKVRSGLKLPPIGCTVRERACAGSYMCSLANICHFVAGLSLFYVKKDWITCAAINNPASYEVRAVIWFMGRMLWVTVRSKRESCNGATHRPWKQKKFNQAPSVRKIMTTVFWDRKGILLIDFLECGLTINADAYCETVRKLRRAIQN